MPANQFSFSLSRLGRKRAAEEPSNQKEITMKPTQEEQGKKSQSDNELTDKDLEGVAGGAVDMFTPNPGALGGAVDAFRPNPGAAVGMQDNSFRPGETTIESFSKPGALGGKLPK
jgi:hypothetical protein